MSGWERIARDVAMTAFGEGATVHIDPRPRGGYVAWAGRPGPAGPDEVLAIGGGESAETALQMLAGCIARPDRSLTTREAAEVLGVDESWLRHETRQGRIVADVPGARNHTARWQPGTIQRLVDRPRRARSPRP